MPKLIRESAREQIRDSILRNIHAGIYEPGQRLREKELAEFYGTSQAPVREALRELEGLQYVETIPYKGTIVKEVTSKDISIAYRLRGEFEKIAVEESYKNESFKLSELKAIAKKVDDAAKANDKNLYAKHNIEFHKYFIDKSDNAMLQRMWMLVSFPVQVEKALDEIDVSLETLSKEHYQIIDALEENNPKRAGELIHSHASSIIQKL